MLLIEASLHLARTPEVLARLGCVQSLEPRPGTALPFALDREVFRHGRYYVRKFHAFRAMDAGLLLVLGLVLLYIVSIAIVVFSERETHGRPNRIWKTHDQREHGAAPDQNAAYDTNIVRPQC